MQTKEIHKSNIPPTDISMVWIDTTDPENIQVKVFLNGKWTSIISKIISTRTVFKGIATPETDPGELDGEVFYFATESGVYENFGGIELDGENLVILKWDGEWSEQILSVPTFLSIQELAEAIVADINKKQDAPVEAGSDGQILSMQSSGPAWINAPEGTVVVDSEMSDESENPVQNNTIKAYVDQLGQYAENPEWVQVVTDSNDKILYGVKTDGKFYFGDGCPPQVVEYVNNYISNYGYNKSTIDSLLNNKVDKVAGKQLSTEDYTSGEKAKLGALPTNAELTTVLNDKVNKVAGKSLIDAEYAASQDVVENPEWLNVTIDSDGRIIEGITKEGDKIITGKMSAKGLIVSDTDITENIDAVKQTKFIDEPEYIYAITDKDGKFLGGINKDGKIENKGLQSVEKSVIDIERLSGVYPLTDGDFNANLSKPDFVTLYNSKLTAFASLCKCQVYCMDKLSVRDTIEEICTKINHNFRNDVVAPNISPAVFMSQLNKYFSIPVYRFMDAKINNTNTVNSSLRVGVNGVQFETRMGEPSTLVSDDGEKIELFSSQGHYTETSDGVNWSTPQAFVYHDFDATQIHGHMSVNKVDGIYMMIAHASYNDDDYFDLLTSEDKINFYYRGHLFQNGVTDIGSGKVTSVLGNTYLLKDKGGVYYLIYEARIPGAGSSWELCLMSCTNILSEQGNGFVGDWTQCTKNPILFSMAYACCNPEIVKGQDNQPLKYNGHFYMYYLSYTFDWDNERIATIRRAKSTNLVDWEDEGIVFDNRDTPDGGEHNADNGDQCLCEFKGRSYFFYTHNINNYGEGTYPVPLSIRYTIDDRPFIELLQIKA